ncbi:hypothetical protein EXU48_05385 [Occultella glacieicola]|uniref:Uncharacterized protein n=1 Tax=Occultella glacieicola TaxID=2518684 RepID=A0ABY2E7T6_9MICO|nr:hypothetical protein [Occultella glacieicola]TDE97609.1 hypothetical protein EXU48_05385 [Occultella glacieicola]
MGDLFAWWLGGGDWYDLEQRRRISDLEASHHASQSSMRRQMHRATTDLATRVNQLESALVAVVELEDTRERLTEHADAAATRRFAREVVAALPALGRADGAGQVTAVPPPDVPGYWLHPASRALAAELEPAVLQGSADPEALLAEARRRDTFQTNQTIVCLAAMTGRPERAHRLLPELYPAGDQVTDDELVIWRAVATGRFGEDARAGLVDALRRVVQVDGPLTAEIERLALGGRRDTGVPAVDAGVGLEKLHAWVSSIVTAPVTGTPGESKSADDALADQLALLITRGAPGEEGILRRMVQIRGALAAIGVSDGPALPPTPDHTAVGSVRETVLGDLDPRPSGPRWRFQMLGGDGREDVTPPDPEHRLVALRVVAPAVAQLADRLVEKARTPPAQTDRVRLGRGVEVTLTPTGPTSSTWQKQVVSTPPLPAWRRPTAIGLGVAAVLLGLLSIQAGPGIIVIGAIAAIAAGVIFYRDRSETARSQAEAQSQRQRAERTIADAQERLHKSVEDSAAAAEAAQTHHRAIVAALEATGRTVSA